MLTQTGSYALHFICNVHEKVQVGKLGVISLIPGWYIYIGSAFGRGGLQSRIRHHLTSAAKPHWHLDYLRSHLSAQSVWYTTASLPYEHIWANICLTLPGAIVPLPRFGASDCKCASHFLYLPGEPGPDLFTENLSLNHAQLKINSLENVKYSFIKSLDMQTSIRYKPTYV